MSVTVERKGKDIETLLAKLPIAMRDKAIKKAIRAASNIVRDEMRRLVPVDTGALRRSIKAVVRDYGEIVVGVVGPEHTGDAISMKRNAIKANVIEYGSTQRNQPPRPFVRPAADNTKRQQETAVIAAITKIINAEVT